MNRDPNSLCIWHPIVAELVLTPRTHWVDFPQDWGLDLLDGKLSGAARNAIVTLQDFGDQLGWPCFMRTDLCSGKHEWLRTCFVPSRGAVSMNIARLLEHNEMVQIPIGLPYTALVIREFLQADAPFTAYRGMPVTMERRVFIRDGEIICDHPYWPEGAIAEGHPTDPDWGEKFAALQESYLPFDEHLIHILASQVADVMPGYWSVDFLRANECWYLIDMALGDQSYHWKGCQHAEKAPQ